MFIEYGELSTTLYELTKPVGRSINGDIEYYFDKLSAIKGRVLEAGVGTGRMLIPLVEKGLIVDGVDLSREMLTACQANIIQHKIESALYLQDLTDLDLPDPYEAIIMPTGSFCLLPKSKIKATLTSFYNHLEENGQLIFDIELPIDFIAGEISVSSYPLAEQTGLLFTSTSETIDWHSQSTSYIHRYELLNNGKIAQSEVSNFVLHWYSVSELELLLAAIGFTTISHEIGYGKDEDSSLITIIAKK